MVRRGSPVRRRVLRHCALGWVLLCALPVNAGGVCDAAAVVAGRRIVANDWVDEAGVERTIGWRAGQTWSVERRQAAQRALEETQIFRAVSVALEPSGGECNLLLRLHRKPTIAVIDVRGAASSRFEVVRELWRWASGKRDPVESLREEELRRLVGIRLGNSFDSDLLDRGTKRILQRYAARGFHSAQVATRVREIEGNEVEIVIDVDAGVPMLVEQVSVEADGEAIQSAVLESLESSLGAARTRALLRDVRRGVRRRLRELGYHESRVRVAWQQLADFSGGLSIEVEAGPRRSIEITGNESLGRSSLLNLDDLYGRAIVTDGTWRRLARSMRAHYQKKGFYEAEVSVDTGRPDRIEFQVVEGGRYSVGDVVISGNGALDEAELKAVIATGRRGLPLFGAARVTTAGIEEDLERLLHAYRKRGFESVSVDASVDLDREEGVAIVTFAVEEGPLSVLSDVRGWAALDDLLPEHGLPAAVSGQPFDASAVAQRRDEVEALLRRRGYRNARVQVESHRSDASGGRVPVGVDWQIDAGPRVEIGDVIVRGNSDVADVVIRRDLPLESGQPVDTDALLDAQQKVYDNGVFRNVSIAPVESGGDRGGGDAVAVRRDVAVAVSPRPPGRVGYGVGYDTRQGLTAFAEIAYANLNHRAQSLRLRGQVGVDPKEDIEPAQYVVSASFVEPRLLDGPWEGRVSGVGERNTRTIDQFDIERYSFFTGTGRDLGDRLRLTLDLQVERAHVFNVLPITFRDRDERDAWTTALSPALVFDGRDSAFDPRSGFFESLRLRYALPGVSDTDLIEIDTQHTHFIPLWRDWTFVYSLRAGWVRSLDDSPVVPIRQRYFLGGGESVRGFAVNSLGPYDGNGNEIGGDLALITKSEVRIPLFWGIGLVVFFDAGGNYLVRSGRDLDAAPSSVAAIRDGSFSLDNFRRAAGLGLRYVTPVGPISVDYGIKLDRRTRLLVDGDRRRESFGEFSVSIGARF